MNAVGIMQGRLSPSTGARGQIFPADTWRDEFPLARACGFDLIEWLVTSDHLEDNPVWTDAGIAAIKEQIDATGIGIRTLCADCFIERRFFRVAESARQDGIRILNHLIVQSATLGIDVVLIPVLESSAIETDADASELLASLQGPLAIAESHGICLALETDLTGHACRSLIARGPSAAFGACYDTGNATERGFNVREDILALSDRLVAVHIKDRHRAGASVALGLGDTDFAEAFDALSAVGYSGPLILETPPGDTPRTTAAAHLGFVRAQLQR